MQLLSCRVSVSSSESWRFVRSASPLGAVSSPMTCREPLLRGRWPLLLPLLRAVLSGQLSVCRSFPSCSPPLKKSTLKKESRSVNSFPVSSLMHRRAPSPSCGLDGLRREDEGAVPAPVCWGDGVGGGVLLLSRWWPSLSWRDGTCTPFSPQKNTPDPGTGTRCDTTPSPLPAPSPVQPESSLPLRDGAVH